ncbi:uncharacterized protein LOC106643459 [Copidosoma floridanum]|uniref:uncharacterized protein LOC106643459 n=1 Tax=Copidosoma floridanum TaxID=29053 RepID=UPI0006C979BE|nr:uncharacterized protein LOC106643459 [Copidosoma floridanum]
MIRCAGGVPELHVVDTRDILNLLIPNSNLIIQLTNADNTSINPKLLNSKLNEELQKKNHRMIAETEIPLAIMYASLDQYCNPTYHFKQLIMRKSLKEDTSEILALDTQDILVPNFDYNRSTCASKRIFVPETNGYTQENEEKSSKN